MIAVFLNGFFLDIAPGSKLSIEIASTIMNDSEELVGSKSWPVLFPYSEKNKAAFRNAHLPENRLARKKQKITIYAFGAAWKEAVMPFKVTEKGYEGNLQIDLTEISKKLKESDITQVFVNYKDGVFESFERLEYAKSVGEADTYLRNGMFNPGTTPFVMFPIANDGKFGGAADGETLIDQKYSVNPWVGTNAVGGTFFYLTTTSNPQYRNFYTPFFYLSWVLERVVKWLGMELSGDFTAHEFIKSLVVYNTGMEDYITVINYSGTSFSFAPARHLPRIKVNEFFKALRKDFSVKIDFDLTNGQVVMMHSDTYLQSEDVVDISECVETVIPPTDPNDKESFEFERKIDDQDELYKLFPYTKTFKVGTSLNSTKIEMGTGTTQMIETPIQWDYTVTDENVRIPFVKQVANIYSHVAKDTPAYNNPDTPSDYCKNNFEFRLLSFKGMGFTSKWNYYPYATSDSITSRGDDAFNYSLDPGGEKGLLSKFSLQWYNFLLDTEKIELVANLTQNKFFALNPLKKVRYTSISKAKIVCVLDKAGYEARTTMENVIGSKMTLYPVYGTSAYSVISESVADGEQGGADPIYLKMHIDTWKTSDNSTNKDWYCNIYITAWRDQNATVQRNVTNLPIKINAYYKGLKTTRTETWDFGCNGHETKVADSYRYFYFRAFGSKLETWKFELVAFDNCGYLLTDEGQVLPSY